MKSRRPPNAGAPAATQKAHRRLLSPEDEAVWRHVVSSVQSLKGAKARVPAAGAVEPAGAPPSIVADSHVRVHRALPASPAEHRPTLPPAIVKAAGSAHRAPPPLAAFERKKVRRIVAGTVEIEARLDLHGARQSEAHHRLRGFIHQCISAGMATVLVITGKGGRREQLPMAPFDDLDARDHGVLRRAVPMWLAEPELRSLVVSFTTAHQRHGGEGALYLHLRRRGGRSGER